MESRPDRQRLDRAHATVLAESGLRRVPEGCRRRSPPRCRRPQAAFLGRGGPQRARSTPGRTRLLARIVVIVYARLIWAAVFSGSMETIRNVARHKLRSFLTISGIVIGVLALTTMGAIAENFNALLDGGVKYFGSNIQIGPPDGQFASLLPISIVGEIKKVNGVAAAFPSYSFPAKPGAAANFSFGIPDQINASDPAENDWAALKATFAQGQQITPGSAGQVVLGSKI